MAQTCIIALEHNDFIIINAVLPMIERAAQETMDAAQWGWRDKGVGRPPKWLEVSIEVFNRAKIAKRLTKKVRQYIKSPKENLIESFVLLGRISNRIQHEINSVPVGIDDYPDAFGGYVEELEKSGRLEL